MNSLPFVFATLLMLPFANEGTAPRVRPISLVVTSSPTPTERYAIGKLEAVLSDRHWQFEERTRLESTHGSFVIAIANGSDSGLKSALGVVSPTTPESFLIRRTSWHEKLLVFVTGGDERGLMYGLLEVAERIGWGFDSANPFAKVTDENESPAVRDRAVTIFTMQQAQFEERLHDSHYWAKYFDMLAQDRYNTFQILFAYEMEGYVCPAYPYFVGVDEFPGVTVSGLTAAQQQSNRDDLKRLMAMAHERGLKITVGLWCHYNRFSVDFTEAKHDKPERGKVFGLNEQNLIPYTQAALAEFLQTFPEIDSIMLLMHGESGIKAEEMRHFWAAIFPVMKKFGPNIQYEMRAKGVPDDLIEAALQLGLKVRMNTKYWAEQVGLPFHPTHVQALNQFERRHGYSDMLKYPHEYELHYTLWTSGTLRILLWADPEYARRFAGTVALGEANGFDVIEPEATKMGGHPHDMKPFELLAPQYRYYEYEFERYWHFFQVFGRLTYNPQTPPEVWDREFQSRFGSAAPFVEQGIHRASQILPRITAYCLPPNHFPTTRGWPERQRQEDLPKYAACEPSDTAQFSSFDGFANDTLNGTESASIAPAQTSRWFSETSNDVLRLAQEAETAAGSNKSKELQSTVVDLRILANLALYHSRRIPAGINYALYKKTGDLNALNSAIEAEKSAIDAWSRIVKAAGDVYSFDLMFGLPKYDLSGHWRDELAKLNKGLADLEGERAKFRPAPSRIVGKYDLGLGPAVPAYERLPRAKPSAFEQNGTNLIKLDVPDGRYRIQVDIQDRSAAPKAHGPMWIEANGFDYTGRFTVSAGERIEKDFETTSADGKLEILFDNDTSADWYASTITITRLDPLIAHAPQRKAKPGQELTVRATVSGVDPLEQVRLVFGLDQSGYHMLEMKQIAPMLYEAVIPGSAVEKGLNYSIEARDSHQRLSIWPQAGSLGSASVLVSDDERPPELRHTPVREAKPFLALPISADVSDASGVKWVQLRYRGLTQHQEFRSLRMLPSGTPGHFEASIPGDQITPQFDLMYLFEVMDTQGNAKIYPDLEKETPYVVVKVNREHNGVENLKSTNLPVAAVR